MSAQYLKRFGSTTFNLNDCHVLTLYADSLYLCMASIVYYAITDVLMYTLQNKVDLRHAYKLKLMLIEIK